MPLDHEENPSVLPKCSVFKKQRRGYLQQERSLVFLEFSTAQLLSFGHLLGVLLQLTIDSRLGLIDLGLGQLLVDRFCSILGSLRAKQIN